MTNRSPAVGPSERMFPSGVRWVTATSETIRAPLTEDSHETNSTY
jgi:hypothetical protein